METTRQDPLRPVYEGSAPGIHLDASVARDQLAALAALPGVLDAPYAMPGVRSGAGFPIGAVAATDVRAGGVIAAAGGGVDLSCGVRLLAAGLDREMLSYRMRRDLMSELDRRTPRTPSRQLLWRLTDRAQLEEVLTGGSRYAVERGHGTLRDLARCEERGSTPGADPAVLSARAAGRGLRQLGGLSPDGGFLEVQAVEEIYDEVAAAAFGLRQGQVCVTIHSGSRGLGQQIGHVDPRFRGGSKVRVPEDQGPYKGSGASANVGRGRAVALLRSPARGAVPRSWMKE